MAGYFSLVGRIITEKGSWYKIAFFVFLQVMLLVFQPKLLIVQTVLDISNINFAGWILYLLATMCAGGFIVQVYSNRVKKDKTALPVFDIPAMLLYAFKIIPFNIVWGIYFAIFAILIALPYAFLAGRDQLGSMAIIFLLLVPFLLLIWLAYPVLLAAHTKGFKYRGFLNPLVIFHVFFRSGFQMFLNFLAYSLSILILIVITYVFLMILGFSVSLSDGVAGLFSNALPMIISVLLVCIIALYFFFVFHFAFIVRTSDIAREQLEDSELLETDYYDLDEEDSEAEETGDALYSGNQNDNSEDDDFRY